RPHPAGPGDGRRAVLETGEPPRRIRRPRRRLADLALYADPAAARLAAGNVPRPAVDVHHRPALQYQRTDTRRDALAAGQRHAVLLGLDTVADARGRALAGQPLHRSGNRLAHR